MRRQRSAALAALGAPGALEIGVGLLGPRVAGGDRRLDILQRQIQLIGIQLLRAPAELHPLQLAQEVPKPIILFFDPPPRQSLGVEVSLHGDQRRSERSDIIGKGVEIEAHDDYLYHDISILW